MRSMFHNFDSIILYFMSNPYLLEAYRIIRSSMCYILFQCVIIFRVNCTFIEHLWLLCYENNE